MKRNLVILLLTLSTFNLFAKSPSGDKVDPLIENKFKTDFGASVKASWQIVQDVAIATYSENGVEKQVYYLSDGSMLGLGKKVSNDLLPQSAAHAIHSRFPSGVIETVYEFKTKDSPTRYFVKLVTPRNSMIVSANEFGDIVVKKKERLK